MKSAHNKIDLFKKTFIGRSDIVPRYWKSKNGSGFSPMCKNEWKEGICKKPCRSCVHADYIPLSDEILLDHLKGNHIIGVYPLLPDNTCCFVAADFDNHNADRNSFTDAKAYCECASVQDFTPYILRSKSGKGFHVYLFFVVPVPGWKARAVAFALLKEAQITGDETEISSFDRLFPNQDQLSGKGFGNLIALPFQGQAAKEGNTICLDPTTGYSKPNVDQWAILQNIQRISEAQLDQIISEWNLSKTSKSNYTGNPAPETDIFNCEFVRFCRDNPDAVKEPLWFALISNLAAIRPGGVSLCHELSKGHPDYSQAKTDSKILHSLNSSGPITCDHIKANGFKCSLSCNVKAPAGLLYSKRKEDPKNVNRKRIKVSFG